MKKAFFLALPIAFLLLTGCEKQHLNFGDTVIEQSLLRVYPTIYQNVDSAELYLHHAEPFVKEASELYRNKYLLAAYQIRNNHWEPLKYTDTLQTLVEYILENGSENEKMRACYLAGRCFEREDDNVTSLDWMYKAWEIVKANKKGKDFDYTIASYIGSKIGYLLASEYACLLAKSYFIENTSNAVTRFDSIFAFNDVSRAHFLVEEFDSAKYYADAAFKLIKELPYNANYFDVILWNDIDLFQTCNDWDAVAQRIPYVTNNKDTSYPDYHGILLANWFLHNKEYDKAYNILKEIHPQNDVKTTYHLQKCYFNLFSAQQKTDSALKYAQLCIAYEDSLLKHSDLSQGHVVDNLYNVKNAQQKENEALKAKIRATNIAIITVSLLFLLTFVAIYLRKKYKQRTIKLENDIKKSEERNNIVVKTLDSVKKSNQSLVEKLQEKEDKDKEEFPRHLYRKFLQEMKEKAQKNTSVTVKEEKYLHEICNYLYPDWENKLEELIPNVNKKHKDVCMLTLLGFNARIITALMGNSKQNILYSRKYLNKRLGNIESGNQKTLEYVLEGIFGPIKK